MQQLDLHALGFNDVGRAEGSFDVLFAVYEFVHELAANILRQTKTPAQRRPFDIYPRQIEDVDGFLTLQLLQGGDNFLGLEFLTRNI